jgi:pimeloyl-ACP methyl ester carboxylesterase
MKKTVKYCSYLIATMLICFSADAATQVVEGETGVGAKYQITMPDNWNGDLVVYAHGIVVDSTLPIALPTVDDIEALRDMLNESGYAVAYSSYSANGFAVREGVLDTHALNAQFTRRFGQPERTFLVGHSLGGTVCVGLAEQYPQQYDGVLTVAGMIGGSQAEIDYMANVRILWEFFYPDVLPGDINEVPDGIDVYNEIVIPIVTAITIDPFSAGAIALIDQTPVPWEYGNGTELVESYATALGYRLVPGR